MSERRMRLLGLFASSLLLCIPSARADTSVSGTISTSTTWTLAGSPYIVTGDVYVEKNGTPVPVLTIQAGVTVKFNSGKSLYIGNSYPGELQAVGTATSQIVLTANSATPTPGYWRSLRFRPNATATSTLVYATVSYGGVGNSLYLGAVNIESASPTLQNVTVQNSLYAGIKLVNGSPVIGGCTSTGSSWGLMFSGTGTPAVSNSTISSNSSGGIWVGSPVVPSFSSVAITNSVGFAISQEAKSAYGTVTGVTATGNTTNGVEIRASTADVSTTWKSFGLPYVVTGDVYVEKNGTPVPVLTIEPGVTVKFNSAKSLYIGNSYPGELQAVGTATSQIVFTANSTSPTPGFWRSLRFRPSATATSALAYATVSYGGVGNSLYLGAVNIESASPTLQNVTVQSSLYAGIKLVNGSPVITNSTVTGNGWGLMLTGTGSPSVSNSTISSNSTGGIWVQAPTSPSLSNLTFTSNVGFAISQEAKTTFGTFSNMTATGNTTNGVEIRASTADVSTTWKSSGLPYVVTGDVYVEKNGTPIPVLTIEAGVTVKFNSATSLFIGNSFPGELQAVGTATSQIVLTANSANPAPGFWRSLRFRPNSTATSSLAYATVSYGGVGNAVFVGGITIESASPTLQTVTVQNNTYAGIRVVGGSPVISGCTSTGNGWGLIIWDGATPAVSNSTFSSNTTGGIVMGGTPPAGSLSPVIVNSSVLSNAVGLQNTTAVSLIAQFNYWSSANGPSGSGSGSGQSVTTKVNFEPWLVAPPAVPQYFNSSTQKNRSFNPAIAVNTTITAAATLAGAWITTIVNSGGTTVRTFSGTALPETVVWDGKNDSGSDQPDGSYSYRLASTSTAGDVATVAQGTAVLDRTKLLTVTNLAVSQSFFSPNGDGVQDTTTLTGTNPFDDTTLTVNVKNPASSVVRTNASSGGDLSYTWDGTNASAVVQPDGIYTLEVVAVNGTASATSSVTVALDDTLPSAAIAAPADGQVLSNVYTNGVTNVTVTGSAGDLNFQNWLLDYGLGAAPSSYTALGSGTSTVSNATMSTWVTAPLANSLYTLRLQVWDRAGNRSVLLIKPTVGNFSVSQSALQLNASSGGTATYASIIPFNVTETLLLKNAAGQVSRTLVNAAARAAGTLSDIWNGKNDLDGFLPDGPYFYSATVTDGTHTFAWDLTNQYLNNYSTYGTTLGASFDPFNNAPLSISYNFGSPGRVSLGFTATSGEVTGGCPPPDFCLFRDKYEESGPHTVYWAGVDSSGQFHGDVKKIATVTQRYNFSASAIVVFGTKPSVTNVTVTPAIFGPATGTQNVAFDLATFQNQAVTVTIAFLNQGSLSTLRTVTVAGQSPGHVTVAWDGRADNGMWVAPGFYTVTVTATDSIGNQAAGQILTTLQF